MNPYAAPILQAKELSSNAKLVGLALAELAHPQGKVTIKNADLAIGTALSLRAVQYATKELEENWFFVIGRREAKPNTYHFPTIRPESPVEPSDAPGSTIPPSPVSPYPQRSAFVRSDLRAWSTEFDPCLDRGPFSRLAERIRRAFSRRAR